MVEKSSEIYKMFTIQQEDSRRITLKFFTLENGFSFASQFIKLYTNLEIFELGTECDFELPYDRLLERLKIQGTEITSIFRSTQILRSNNSQIPKEEREDFVLNGLLTMLYKYLKGVLYQVSHRDLKNIGFAEVVDSFSDSFRNLSALVGLPSLKSKE